MIPLLSDARRFGLRYFFGLHPEWWSAGLCWLAWAALALENWRGFGHDARHAAFVRELTNWMLMAAAMMLPLVLGSVQVTAIHSLWARRHRAILGFLTGYFGPWLGVGIVAAGLRELVRMHAHAAPAVGFAASALWQISPMHLRAVNACYRRLPLAPLGWRADLDCLRYGSTVGVACVWSCWPMMLACALAGHALIAMVGAMVLSAVERWSFRPRPRAVLAGTLGMAGYYVSLAVLHPGLAFGQAPVSEVLGATKSAFYLERGATHISMETHPPISPALTQPEAHKRVFLNIDAIRSQAWSAPYDVYLNLPRNDRPGQHPELRAGSLPMFGLVEASRSSANDAGLYEQLDVTALYVRLAASPGWDGKNLRISFVPSNASAVRKIEIGRVSLQVVRTDP